MTANGLSRAAPSHDAAARPGPTGGRRLGALLPIIVAAFALRVWWSAPFSASPWLGDPDGYLEYARALADGTGPWRWSVDAVRYAEFYKAPFYQVLMSAFTAYPGVFTMPGTALLVHAALNSFTVLCLFFVGRALHSSRAGLFAALAYAGWPPNILLTSTAWQEHLYVPLLVAGLALLGRAVRAARRIDWALAGAVLGAAALARSSIAYFIVPAALLWVGLAPERRRALAQAGLLALAFAAVTLPYSAWVSSVARQPVFVENIGYFALKRSPASATGLRIESFMEDPRRAPGASEAIRYFASDVARDPAGFVTVRADLLRTLLKPMGPMLLPSMSAETGARARWLKVAVHALVDVPFVLCVILAPLGAVLCRAPRFGALLLLWIALLLSMLALTSWAGVRFRVPVEPVLIVLAAVTLSGGWRRPRAAVLAAAIALSVVGAALTLSNIKAVAQARANYGVGEWAPYMTEAEFTGNAGLHVIAGQPRMSFVLTRTDRTPEGPMDVTVRLDGRPADRFRLTGEGPWQASYPRPDGGVVYLEISVTAEARAVPLRLRIETNGVP